MYRSPTPVTALVFTVPFGFCPLLDRVATLSYLSLLGWMLDLPSAFVVLFMSQDLPDEDDLVLEEDL
jgi:hypothetical protein